MDKKYVIKLFRVRRKTLDRQTKNIVVAFNTTKVNGGVIDKIGYVANYKKGFVGLINLRKLGYWLNKGAIIKSTKVYFYVSKLNWNV